MLLCESESRSRLNARIALWIAIPLLFFACSTTLPQDPKPDTLAEQALCDLETASGICFHLIGHRGAAAYAPENTLASVEKAVALGTLEVEIDVQLSKDGVVMLFHDGTLDEKTNLTGPVREHTAAVLLEADIGSWFDKVHPESEERFAGTPLDRFEDLLSEFGDRIYYHVELKSLEPELPGLVVEALERHNLIRRATITSFDVAQLERTRLLSPRSPTCWLLRSRLPKDALLGEALLIEQTEMLERAKRAGFQMVGIRANRLSPEILALARAQGLGIRAFGIKNDADMERVLALAADGMTTNWPDRLRARLESQRP